MVVVGASRSYSSAAHTVSSEHSRLALRVHGARGGNHVLDADIRDYFGSIDQTKLLKLVARHQFRVTYSNTSVSPLAVGAYHSLHAPASSLPSVLDVTARTEAGLVMALRHRHVPAAAVQFHPESILSAAGGHGLALVRNAVSALVPAAADPG